MILESISHRIIAKPLTLLVEIWSILEIQLINREKQHFTPHLNFTSILRSTFCSDSWS